MNPGRPRRGGARTAAVLVAALLIATASVPPVRPAPAEAVPLLSRIPVVNALAGLFGTTRQRTRTYKEIGAARDAELADLKLREQAVKAEHDRGRIPDDLYDVEKARLTALKSAVVERARREKAIAEHTYDRLVGKAAFALVQAALLTPGSSKAGQLLTALVTGDDPTQAIARLLPQLPSVPQLEDLRRLQREWQDAKAVLQFVRAPEDAVQRLLRQELQSAVTRASARIDGEATKLLREGIAEGADLSPEQRARLDALQADIATARDVFDKARAQWRTAGTRAEQAVLSRYLKDARLLSIIGRIQDLKVSRASKAVVAAYARASEERVVAVLRSRGIDPSAVDLDGLIVEVSLTLARTRLQARDAGEDPWSIDADAVIAKGVDVFLATAGADTPVAPSTTKVAAATVTATGRFTNLAPSPFEKNEVRLRYDPRGGPVTGTAAIVLSVSLPGCADRFSLGKDGLPTIVPPPITLRESWAFTLTGTLDASGAMRGTAVLQWSMAPDGCNGKVQYKAAGYALSWSAQRAASGVVTGKLTDAPYEKGCKVVQDAYKIQPHLPDGTPSQVASQTASCLGTQTFDPTGPSFELRP